MGEVMGARDRRETDEEMALATSVLMAARERFMEAPGLTEPRPGSMLAAENVDTPFDPVGYQIQRHRVRAVDALEMLMDSMYDPVTGKMVARPMAMYALVRMSIEATAVAMWTIESSKKHDRIFRSLQVAYAHLHEFADFASAISPEQEARPYVDFRDRKTERLIEIKNRFAALQQRELKRPPKLWAILQKVSPAVPAGHPQKLDSPYAVWKMTSGFLHGSDHLTLELGDRQQVTEGDPLGAEFVVTPSWRLLCSCVAICVSQLERLDERVAYLATTAYGERPLT